MSNREVVFTSQVWYECPTCGDGEWVICTTASGWDVAYQRCNGGQQCADAYTRGDHADVIAERTRGVVHA